MLVISPPTAHPSPLPPGQFRARLWLFFTLLVAVGAVGGSVAVLIACTQSEAPIVSVGVGSVLQCGFVLAASLLFWAFRSGETDGAGYGYIGGY